MEREELKVGDYYICFFDGTEINGIWIRNEEDEGMQVKGKYLEKFVKEMWEGF